MNIDEQKLIIKSVNQATIHHKYIASIFWPLSFTDLKKLLEGLKTLWE
jgi:hypothetical protein